jgi:L-ascorbate metabolism protein UlaG (beta-lactamase superfamily)
MRLTYWGTAMVLLEYAGLRLVTDPAFDPKGTRYDFGPWYTPRSWFASEKLYDTPTTADALEPVDAILLSHDHHADNLDLAGRAWLARTKARIYTTRAGGARLAGPLPRQGSPGSPGDGLGLGARAIAMTWHGSERVEGSGGAVRITATPARHGPVGTPRVHEVNGWLLESDGGKEPTVWISGDTVMFPALRDALQQLVDSGNRVDVVVVHCGGVSFPKVPVLGRRLFTFDSRQAVDACRLLSPRWVVPIHRAGWLHFREPESQLRQALAALAPKTRCELLEPGASITCDAS